MKPKFALAIPHASWREERVWSADRLWSSLVAWSGVDASPMGTALMFTERKPNREWSMDLWTWAARQADIGCTHLLQLQDDIVPGPRFWERLSAMVEANPDAIIGLQSQHPIGRSLANMGRRWYKTQAWLVGPQYVMPLTGPNRIGEMLNWLDEHPEVVANSIGEDVTISTWVKNTRRYVWHPIPAIADVDMTIPSTYEGNDLHDHRRPTVTWHGYNEAQLESIEYWTPPIQVETVPGPSTGECTFCGVAQGFVRSTTGATMCKQCVANILSSVLSKA